MKTVKTTQINFKVDERLNAFINRFSDSTLPERVREDLETLHWLLNSGERKSEGLLSDEEARLICDVMNGHHYTPGVDGADPVSSLALLVHDGCLYDGLDKKWGVDGAALEKKVQAMESIQALAIMNKAREWWNQEEQSAESIRKMFRIPSRIA